MLDEVVTPVHRTVVVVDVEDSTSRTNTARARLRRSMYELIGDAFRASGIGERCLDPFFDRGDGLMALVRPSDDVPKTLLLHTFAPTLAGLLAAHNGNRPDDRFRLRVAIHAGEVHYDRYGVFGEAVDLAFRLVSAPKVKAGLRQASAPLVLVVSDDIRHSVIRHHYDGGAGQVFEPAVRLWFAGRQQCGWVSLSTPLGVSSPARAGRPDPSLPPDASPARSASPLVA
ncbi:hypothetical protein ACQPYE_10270 [Actinosynnema sp. CA-299493]